MATSSSETSAPTSISQVDLKRSDQVAGFVSQRYRSRSNFRQAMERQWYLDIAQYVNLQYHSWNAATAQMMLPPTPPHRVRLTCNRLMPIVRKGVSKVLRQRPMWKTIPATGEAEDQATSEIANKVLEYYWRYLELDPLLVRAFTWMFTTGNVFMRVLWDPDLGPELDLDEEDLALLSPDQMKVVEDGIHLGDLCVEMATPFEIDPDPDATDFRDIRELIHTKAVDIGELADRYGNSVKALRPDAGSDDSMSRYFERRIQGLQSGGGMSYARTRDEEKDQILRHELWVAPSRRYQRGHRCVIAGGKYLEGGDLPNPFKRIPYVHMQEIPQPGRLWGMSSLEYCIPLQSEYNRGRSQLVEIRNLMSKPKYFVPKGSGVLDTALNSEPGEVVFHNPGLPPVKEDPPNVPEYVMRLLEYALKDIEDVSAVHEVTQARAPSGVRAGVAINLLQEQDDQTLAPVFLTAEKALSCLGAWALELIATNISEPRLVKISGKDRGIDAMTFMGKDLVGRNAGHPGVNYFDVETQMSSQLPTSSLARRDYIVSLAQTGILNPQTDRKKIFRALELGTDEPALNDEALDRQAALRENAYLRQGVPLPINAWDDDMAHVEEHRRDQKSPDYLAVTTPEVRQVAEMHIQEHLFRLQSQMAPPPGNEPPVPPMQDPGAEEPPDEMQQQAPPFEGPPQEAQGMMPEELVAASQGSQGIY